MAKTKDERFEQLGTKIDPAMAEVLDACCNAMGVDVYHLLQWFAYTIVKASAPMHSLDHRIQKLMTMLDRDAGWQTAFNLCNPDKLKVAQVILILEQEGHKGFGAVMIDKPWMGMTPEMVDDLDPKRADPQMTENVDDILEQVAKVTMPGIYKRMSLMEDDMECNNLSDVLLTMLDAQDLLNAVERDASEGPQMGDIALNGRALAYGKRTKRKKHYSPDTMPVTGNLFDDIDHEAPAEPLKDWEGERHDTR